MSVHCYHVYISDEDQYDGHFDLCDECAKSFTVGDSNTSLHDSGPTTRPCEICSAESE